MSTSFDKTKIVDEQTKSLYDNTYNFTHTIILSPVFCF